MQTTVYLPATSWQFIIRSGARDLGEFLYFMHMNWQFLCMACSCGFSRRYCSWVLGRREWGVCLLIGVEWLGSGRRWWSLHDSFCGCEERTREPGKCSFCTFWSWLKGLGILGFDLWLLTVHTPLFVVSLCMKIITHNRNFLQKLGVFGLHLHFTLCTNDNSACGNNYKMHLHTLQRCLIVC